MIEMIERMASDRLWIYTAIAGSTTHMWLRSLVALDGCSTSWLHGDNRTAK